VRATAAHVLAPGCGDDLHPDGQKARAAPTATTGSPMNGRLGVDTDIGAQRDLDAVE
jgi:hypothetical protein